MSRRGRPGVAIELSKQERDFLHELAHRRSAPAIEVKRAKAILLMAEGLHHTQIAARVGFCSATVGNLRQRFSETRLEGLSDLPRSGPPRTIDDQQIQQLKDFAEQASGSHSLEHPQDGPTDGHFSRFGVAHLESLWAQAASR